MRLHTHGRKLAAHASLQAWEALEASQWCQPNQASPANGTLDSLTSPHPQQLAPLAPAAWIFVKSGTSGRSGCGEGKKLCTCAGVTLAPQAAVISPARRSHSSLSSCLGAHRGGAHGEG